MKNGARVATGFLIAFFGQFFALFLSGSGEGWNTPLWVSLILWISYPLVLVRPSSGANWGVALAALILAFAADATLILLTLSEGMEYFLKVVRFPGEWWIVSLWFLVWIGWQVIAAARLIRYKFASA